MGVPSLIIDLGTKNVGPGESSATVTFTSSYDYVPTVVLTSTTLKGGGSTNAYVSNVTTTGFTINVSDEGNSVDICWRAILDRQKGPQGKGNAPQPDDDDGNGGGGGEGFGG